GRYGRCAQLNLETELPGRVSRCHVLLRGEPGGPVAYDLCSTNGTFVGDRQVRRHALRDGMPLSLAHGEALLEWEAVKLS
ncbi:MAG: FHA domain-containing protein, partial [Deltaproteobacteria bacterium]